MTAASKTKRLTAESGAAILSHPFPKGNSELTQYLSRFKLLAIVLSALRPKNFSPSATHS